MVKGKPQSSSRNSTLTRVLRPISSLVLLILLIVLCGAYVFFVGASVTYVAAEKDTRNSIQDIKESISKLESEYASLGGQITMETATRYGYTEDIETRYVNTSAASVSFNPYAR